LDVAVASVGVVVEAPDFPWDEVGGVVSTEDETAVVDSTEDETAVVDSAVLLASFLEVVLASAVVEGVGGMVTCTCEVAVLDCVSPAPVTPGLAVGIVTETAAELAATGVLVLAIVVVVAFSTAGHKAGNIPPVMTIPNNAFGFTNTFAQPLWTSFAT